MSLINVCYEQIHDNFWYGSFGKFKLIIDKNTGYFNASKLCQDGGKLFKNWLRNKYNRELVAYVNKARIRTAARIRAAAYVVNNGLGGIGAQIRGTYVPKELILSIASWMSPEFYLKCSDIVEDYFLNEYKENLEQVKEELLVSKNQTNSLKRDLEELQDRFKMISEDVTPKTIDKDLLHTFAVIQKNDSNAKYPFKVIRAQKRGFHAAMRSIRRKHPKAKVIAETPYNPNSVNLFNRIKENVDYIDSKYNNFRLDNVPIEMFVAEINKIPRIK